MAFGKASETKICIIHCDVLKGNPSMLIIYWGPILPQKNQAEHNDLAPTITISEIQYIDQFLLQCDQIP